MLNATNTNSNELHVILRSSVSGALRSGPCPGEVQAWWLQHAAHHGLLSHGGSCSNTYKLSCFDASKVMPPLLRIAGSAPTRTALYFTYAFAWAPSSTLCMTCGGLV